MRRLAVILLICLILGAIAQTLVSLGCALWIEPGYVGNSLSAETTELQWMGNLGGNHAPDDPTSGVMDVPVRFSTYYRGFGVTQITTHSIDLDEPSIDSRLSGWPIHSWLGKIEGAQIIYARTPTKKVDEFWFLNPGEDLDLRAPSGHTPIPVAVIPLGFIANTALYGLVLFAVFLAHRRVVMIIRARRNRCVQCNYDLREIASDRCPECGATRAVSRAFPT